MISDNLSKTQQGPVLITGPSGLFTLSMVWQVDFYEKGIPVLNIDCAIRFNVFPIADEALRRGYAAEDVLSSIYVQRAFNPYQILDVLSRILQSKADFPWLPVILAPAKQFFDGDVGKEEGAYMLGRMLKIFYEMKNAGIPYIIAEKESYPSVYFPEFLKKLRSFIPVHHHISPGGIRKNIHNYSAFFNKRGKSDGPYNPSLFRADFHDRGPSAELPKITA